MHRPQDTIFPLKSEIFDYWANRLHEHGLLIDWGEPGCWACGFHYGTKYDLRNPSAPWEEVLRCWERIPLQRAHIVSRSLCGSDSVENRFLICRECHDLAPNTNIPSIFFEWARHQSHEARENAKIREAMRAFGLEERDCPRLESIINSQKFRSWSEGRSGIHWPQSNYASVSSRMTPATTVGLIAYYMREVAGR